MNPKYTNARVTKLSEDNPGRGSLPVGFCAEGPAWSDPKKGEMFELHGFINIKSDYHEKVWTEFHTTEVLQISKNDDGSQILKTKNSVWKVEKI
jgi:hypothetical protein